MLRDTQRFFKFCHIFFCFVSIRNNFKTKQYWLLMMFQIPEKLIIDIEVQVMFKGYLVIWICFIGLYRFVAINVDSKACKLVMYVFRPILEDSDLLGINSMPTFFKGVWSGNFCCLVRNIEIETLIVCLFFIFFSQWGSVCFCFSELRITHIFIYPSFTFSRLVSQFLHKRHYKLCR